MNNEKYYQIKVTAKAPEGFKPRTMSLTGLGVSNKADAPANLEAKAIEQYSNALHKANPEGIDFNFSAVSTKINPHFIIVDNEEPAKAKRNKKEVAPAAIESQDATESTE